MRERERHKRREEKTTKSCVSIRNENIPLMKLKKKKKKKILFSHNRNYRQREEFMRRQNEFGMEFNIIIIIKFNSIFTPTHFFLSVRVFFLLTIFETRWMDNVCRMKFSPAQNPVVWPPIPIPSWMM